MTMNPKELTKRILVALFGIPILFAGALLGKWIFLVLVDIIIFAAAWEFFSLAEKAKYRAHKTLGVISVLVISWDIYLNQGGYTGWIFLSVVFVSMINELFKKNQNHFSNFAITISGVGYISFFSFFLLIRECNAIYSNSYTDRGWLIVYIFALIWICDSSAYFIGYNFGRHPLYRRISPNKTWEGALGGFFATVVSATGLKFILAPFVSIIDSLMLGIIVGITGQLSDLIESMYKRDIGVKDTSQLLPGHGGILDRFDSSMLIAPVIYLYFILKSLLLSS
jgi:phosphatidate cytidylyltransferase